MKRTFLLLAAAALCMTAGAQGTFTLKGNVRNADGQKVKIMYGSDEKQQADSTIVKNGQFGFTGRIDKPYSSVIVVFGNYDPYSRDNKYLRAYADAGSTTTIDADINNLKRAVVKGGKTQTEANELEAMMIGASKAMNDLDSLYEATQSAEEHEAIKVKLEPYQEFYRAAQTCFVKTHPDSYISAEQMRFMMGEMTYDEIKAIYDSFTPNVKQNAEACREIETELATLAKLAKGSPAPDFTANDINGKPFTLSSLKGKVVIIDFWASWCVPCRKSNPHMLELYKKYHDAGLDMVYVSDDDSNPAAWKKAVDKDQLTGDGFHHVLRGMKWDRSKGMAGIDHSNDISDKYAIHFLPTKYLIDRNGNIVCKIGEGEEEMLDLWLGYLLSQKADS
jgi:thiol-disulfide isomerase/thioredoxin